MKTLVSLMLFTLLFTACQNTHPSRPANTTANARAGRPYNAQQDRFEDTQQPPYATSPGDATR